MPDEINPSDYLLKNDYILFIPSLDLDANPRRVLLYDVVAMLELRHTDQPLTGHPDEDLPAGTWGGIDFPAHRVKRWVERGRLVKGKPNKSRTGWRITYAEPKEWQQIITEEEWTWLTNLCQVSHLYRAELLEKQRETPPIIEETTPKQAAPEPRPKRRLKAKERRKRQKMEQHYGTAARQTRRRTRRIDPLAIQAAMEDPPT